ncbi:MAG: hypothetical protein HFH00_11635 [Dorea sp.]|nr:hypothetical protein [Dorea sp.]
MFDFKKSKGEREDERLGKMLRNMERKDRVEQKLGIDRTLTRIRDERALSLNYSQYNSISR